jgi:hypothetical protein
LLLRYLRNSYNICGTREGWPLLTVATELNGDSTRTNDRGPSFVASLDSPCRYNRFLYCLGCSSQPSTQYYFPRRTLFHFISRHHPATWAVRCAGPPISVSQLLFYIPSPKLPSSLHFQSSYAFTEADNIFCDLYCCESTLELYYNTYVESS